MSALRDAAVFGGASVASAAGAFAVLPPTVAGAAAAGVVAFAVAGVGTRQAARSRAATARQLADLELTARAEAGHRKFLRDERDMDSVRLAAMTDLIAAMATASNPDPKVLDEAIAELNQSSPLACNMVSLRRRLLGEPEPEPVVPAEVSEPVTAPTVDTAAGWALRSPEPTPVVEPEPAPIDELSTEKALTDRFAQLRVRRDALVYRIRELTAAAESEPIVEQWGVSESDRISGLQAKVDALQLSLKSVDKQMALARRQLAKVRATAKEIQAAKPVAGSLEWRVQQLRADAARVAEFEGDAWAAVMELSRSRSAKRGERPEVPWEVLVNLPVALEGWSVHSVCWWLPTNVRAGKPFEEGLVLREVRCRDTDGLPAGESLWALTQVTRSAPADGRVESLAELRAERVRRSSRGAVVLPRPR